MPEAPQFTEEQEQLRSLVRKFLEEHSSESAVRAHMGSERGFEPELWRRLAAELGLVGLIVPEAHGGAGLGGVELALVMEEMGRALLCAPYFSTAVLAAGALLESGDEAAQADLLPSIAAGRCVAALVFGESLAPWEPDAAGVRARRAPGGWRLEGAGQPVIDGAAADVLLVAARGDAGLSLFRVAAAGPGVTRSPLPPLDLTRRLARVELRDAPAQLLGAEGRAAPALERALDRGLAALAAEQVGGAQRCLDLALEHARTRIQFGRPIGSFQAIKHRCADLLVQVEMARSAAYAAGLSAAQASDELPGVASMAKAYASEAFLHAAGESIQIHGGVGFTWEHPAHLYFKRAKSSALLLGDAVHHRDRVARLLGL
jgi:alkylation response protein AidB-like acyl-CoA dehydrogenase